MAQHILMHIENKGQDANKILYYDDGTVEVRSPKWVLMESQQLGHELTMLDIENQFLVIFEEDNGTPKAKAKLLRKLAKEKAKQEGDLKKLLAIEASENEVEDEDPFMEGEPLEGADTTSPAQAETLSPVDRRFAELEQEEEEAEEEEAEELSA